MSWALRELTFACSEVDRALTRRLGLRPLDHTALEHVMTADEPLGPAELAKRLGISSGSATELADRLEQAGHLRRERHPTDRRRLGLHPTESAVGQVVAALSPLVDACEVVADTLSEPQQEVVARYLRSIAAVMHDFAAGTGS